MNEENSNVGFQVKIRSFSAKQNEVLFYLKERYDVSKI